MALSHVTDSIFLIWLFFLITWYMYYLESENYYTTEFYFNVMFFTTLKRPVKSKQNMLEQ